MSAVAIFGCGPAGLLTAHAVATAGYDPVIFSTKVKSVMPGAIYLHRSIPGIHPSTDPEFRIKIVKSGIRAGYAFNVYGDPMAEVSWDRFDAGDDVPAWSLSDTYDKLWDWYSGNISPMTLTQRDIGVICNNYPLVLSTIPATAICGNPEHYFNKQEIWIQYMYDGLLGGVNDGNMIYYNGCPWREELADAWGELIGPDWYRYSQINKHRAWEFSHDPHVYALQRDDEQLHHGYKPRGTTCNCWLKYNNFYRLGRFGKWEPGVLTHHAYEDAVRILEDSHALL